LRVGPGRLGQASFGQAAAIAFADLGGGTVIVVNQIDKAETMFGEIESIAPGLAAVWTREHDALKALKVPKAERKLKEAPLKMFTQKDLAKYPVIIVTDRMFTNVNGDKARLWLDGSLDADDKPTIRVPRGLILMDERVDAVRIHTVSRAQIDAVADRAADLGISSEGVEALTLLWQFAKNKAVPGAHLEKPDLREISLFPDMETGLMSDDRSWFTRCIGSGPVKQSSSLGCTATTTINLATSLRYSASHGVWRTGSRLSQAGAGAVHRLRDRLEDRTGHGAA
jgi:hypothetical protein